MMNEISLKSYIREIEGLVNRNQNEEAIAHCRYILKSYPRYIDAYRILGKALLESQRFGDATDIFQRVLSSIPDDFISHVGMSVVREDEGNLNEAIWHMERAFEIQPANSTIQDELRRLYGRRDGVEPPKIRLTRGALARMYDKGDLYQQAITELRATLAEYPGRYDLQTLLATIYLKTGQKVEAAETANHILRNLPNCFVPIKIMIQILIESDREAEAKNLFIKLNHLDPYSQFASPKSPSSENVSENAILIEKLDWKQEKHDNQESQQPDWATSLGINIEETSKEESETIPDWISELSPSEEDITKNEDEEMDEEFPEWLSELDDSEEELGTEEKEQDFSPTTQEELPDWLQEMDITEEEEEIEELTPQTKLAAEEPEEILPDWLREIEAPDEIEPESEEVKQGITATSEEELPDWLQDFKETVDEPEIEETETIIAETPQEELPDWLQEMDTTEEEEEIEELTPQTKLAAEEPEEILPDWLQEIEAPDEIEPESEEVKQGITATSEEELPDWLQDFKETVDEPEIEETETIIAETPQEELPDWLQEMDTTEEEEEIEELTPQAKLAAEELEEILPDWLREIEAPDEIEPESEEVKQGITATSEEELPDWLQDFKETVDEPEIEETETIIAETPQEELPDWLQEMETTEEEEEIEELTPQTKLAAEEPEEILPDWLREIEAPDEIEPESEEVKQGITATSKEELPDWLQDFKETVDEPEIEETETIIAKTPQEELPDWLQEMDKTEEKEEVFEPTYQGKLTTKKPEESLPDWLQEIEAPDEEKGVIQERLSAEHPEELPEWLQDFKESEEEIDIKEAEIKINEIPKEEIPDWLWEMDTTEKEEKFDEPTPQAKLIAEEPEESLPDWLQEIEAPDEEEPEVIETEQEIAATPADELPDWLREMEEEQELILGDTQPTQVSDQPVMEPFVEEISFESLGDAVIEVDIPESESQEKYFDQEATSQKSEWEKAEKEEIDAAYAWLESLAVKRGTQEGLQLSPEERSETLPDWIKDSVEYTEDDFVGEIQEIDDNSRAPEFDEIEEEMEEEIFLEEYDDEMESIASAIVTAELRSLEIQHEEVEEEIPEESIAEQKKPPLESEVDEVEILMIGEEEEIERTPIHKKLEFQPESIPSIEEEPIEGRTVDDVNNPTEILEARQSMNNADFERGIIQYAGLIKDNQFLDLIVQDLEELSQTHSNEFGVWQNLGDAYLRLNQVNEALQAYIKAEQILE